MTDDDETTNEIGERERAFIKGHEETERRLLESSRWNQEDVDDLLTAVKGYEDFARCVIDELRWDQRDENS